MAKAKKSKQLSFSLSNIIQSSTGLPLGIYQGWIALESQQSPCRCKDKHACDMCICNGEKGILYVDN